MPENLNEPQCIRTFTGKYFNVFEPNPDLICIADIAHALSQMPRFGGHLPHFYSVAQHSLSVMQYVEPKLKLAALLHDASEAYLMDLPRPIKREIKQYNKIEARLMAVIALKFGFVWPLHEDIKIADEAALQVEWNLLMLGRKNGSMDMKEAEKGFLTAFKKLTSF
jgi:hypothetical protein